MLNYCSLSKANKIISCPSQSIFYILNTIGTVSFIQTGNENLVIHICIKINCTVNFICTNNTISGRNLDICRQSGTTLQMTLTDAQHSVGIFTYRTEKISSYCPYIENSVIVKVVSCCHD